MQWTGCHGEDRHGGDRGCGGGYNGQGVMVRRDMEVTEVVEEDATDKASWRQSNRHPQLQSEEDDCNLLSCSRCLGLLMMNRRSVAPR